MHGHAPGAPRAKEDAREQLSGELSEMVAALEKIVPQALDEEDLSGAALGALTLGQLHYLRQEFDKSVEAVNGLLSACKAIDPSLV